MMPPNRPRQGAPSPEEPSPGDTSPEESSSEAPGLRGRPPYDAVTAYFTCEEGPFRVRQVQSLRRSEVPGTGEPAVQVVQAPWAPVPERDLGAAGPGVLEARAEGLFEMHLILLWPGKIDYLVFERGGERWEASLEEALRSQ